jgi:hypothetical protein
VSRTTGLLKPRDYEIARMLATGHTQAEVGAAFGLSHETIHSKLAQRPALRQLVQAMRDAIAEELQKEIHAKLVQDAPKNIDFIAQLRDGKVKGQGDSADHLRVRLIAGRTLLERQVPKHTHVTQDQTVRFVFAPEERREIEADMELVAEDDGD